MGSYPPVAPADAHGGPGVAGAPTHLVWRVGRHLGCGEGSGHLSASGPRGGGPASPGRAIDPRAVRDASRDSPAAVERHGVAVGRSTHVDFSSLWILC